MGDTIWVRRKSRAGREDALDDVDHSLFSRHAEALDALAERLGVRRLTEFFDYTDVQYTMAEEDLPENWVAENEQWFAPAEALPPLAKIIAKLKSGPVRGVPEDARSELVEELEHCLGTVAAAGSEGDRFHFCVVM